MKHTDMTKLAQEVREILFDYTGEAVEAIDPQSAADYERVADYIRKKVQSSYHKAFSLLADRGGAVLAFGLSKDLESAILSVLPKDAPKVVGPFGEKCKCWVKDEKAPGGWIHPENNGDAWYAIQAYHFCPFCGAARVKAETK